MKMPDWKVVGFFSVILSIALLLYPSQIEIIKKYQQSSFFTKARKEILALLSKSPHDPEVLFTAAQNYEDEGDSEKAYLLYKKAIKYAPQDHMLHIAYLRLLLASNRIKEAMQERERFYLVLIQKNLKTVEEKEYILDLLEELEAHYVWFKLYDKRENILQQKLLFYSDKLPIYYSLIDSAIMCREKDKAYTLIKEAIKLFPSDIALKQYLLELTAYFPDKLEESLQTARFLIKNDSQNIYNWFELLDVLKKMNKIDGMDKVYKDFFEKFPKNLDAAQSYFYFLLERNKNDEAIVFYENFVKQSGNSLAKEFLLTVYTETKKFHKVVKLLEKKVASSPNNINYLMQYAIALENIGDIDGSIKQFEKVLLLSNNNIKVLEQLGERYLWMNRPDKAEQIFNRIYELDSTHLIALKRLGQIHAWNSNVNKGIEIFKRYNQLKWDDYEVHYQLGELYIISDHEQLGKKHLLIGLNLLQLKELLTKQDEEILARFFSGLGYIQKAQKQYEKLMKEYPDDVAIYEDYVEILINQKRYEKAFHYIMNAPTNTLARIRLRRLLARIFIENEDYGNAGHYLRLNLQKTPYDLGGKSELAYVYLQRGEWAKALHLYQDVLYEEERTYDDHSTTRDVVRNILLEHSRYVQALYSNKRIGKDRTISVGLRVMTPITEQIELTTESYLHRIKDGGESSLGRVQRTFRQENIIIRYIYNLFWNYYLGVNFYVNSPISFASFFYAITYNNQKNLFMKFESYFYRLWMDPVRATVLGGYRNGVYYQVIKKVFDRFNLIVDVTHDNLYLKKTWNTAKGKIGYRTSIVSTLEFLLTHYPKTYVYYSYAWANASTDSRVEKIVGLIERERTHFVGFRWDHDVFPGLNFHGSLFIGDDSSRGLHMDNFDLYGFGMGIKYAFSDLLELEYDHVFSSESNDYAGGGRYKSDIVKLKYRF